VSFKKKTYLAILNDADKRMTPNDKKGVSTETHYKAVTPQHFVPPFLHLQIGMVNQAWDSLEEWINNVVEIITEHEKDARKKLKDASKLHAIAVTEKKEADKTINIEIRQKNAELKVLKTALRRKGLNDIERTEYRQESPCSRPISRSKKIL